VSGAAAVNVLARMPTICLQTFVVAVRPHYSDRDRLRHNRSDRLLNLLQVDAQTFWSVELK
jgi:hypothetical protein